MITFLGGKHFAASTTMLRKFGRIDEAVCIPYSLSSFADFDLVACGHTSQYDIPFEKQYGVRSAGSIPEKRPTWLGFTMIQEGYSDKHAAEHQTTVQEWIKGGDLEHLLSAT